MATGPSVMACPFVFCELKAESYRTLTRRPGRVWKSLKEQCVVKSESVNRSVGPTAGMLAIPQIRGHQHRGRLPNFPAAWVLFPETPVVAKVGWSVGASASWSESWERFYCFVFSTSLWALRLLFGRSVVSDSSWPHGLPHTKLPCPSPSPRVCSNSCPVGRWWRLTISSSVARFFLGPQYFPASESFPVISHQWPKYWSFSFNISPSREYSGLISFRIDWFGLLAV